MQLGKVKSYKEIIFGALNMEKMIQDFFGFIKEQKNKKSPDIVRDIYIYHIYEYRHYYPYYQYPYYYLSSTPTWTTTTTATPSWNYNALTSSSTTLTGTMSGDLTMNSGVATTGYSTTLNELDALDATTSYYSTATTSSTSQDFSLEYEGSMDNKIDDLYSKLSKINENNL
jgi:Fic family protein